MSRVQGVLLGGGALLVLAGAAMVMGPGSASGQAQATLTIAPPSQNVKANGDTVTVDVKAGNVSNLGAYDLTLKFDNTKLEFIGAADQGYLATTGRSQTCIGFGAEAATVNADGAAHVGCNTNGLVENGQGKKGPSGSGTLASFAFKPKSTLGTADLVFVGIGSDTYYLGAPDPTKSEGAREGVHTALSAVEVCDGGECTDALDISFSEGTGVIAIIDPQAATPTALPPTPTPKPRKTVTNAEFEETVAAAVGTPRILGTPGASGTPATGTVAGDSGTTGSGSAAAGSSTGGAGSVTGLPEGVTIGADGIARGPDGVPIAGYGPQPQETNPWWIRSGLALLLAGALTVTAGATRWSRFRRAMS